MLGIQHFHFLDLFEPDLWRAIYGRWLAFFRSQILVSLGVSLLAVLVSWGFGLVPPASRWEYLAAAGFPFLAVAAISLIACIAIEVVKADARRFAEMTAGNLPKEDKVQPNLICPKTDPISINIEWGRVNAVVPSSSHALCATILNAVPTGKTNVEAVSNVRAVIAFFESTAPDSLRISVDLACWIGTNVNVISLAPGESKSLVVLVEHAVFPGKLFALESAHKTRSGNPRQVPLESLNGDMQILLKLTAEHPVYTARFHLIFDHSSKRLGFCGATKQCPFCSFLFSS